MTKPTSPINDIFPPWWDFVMWGICWVTMIIMVVMAIMAFIVNMVIMVIKDIVDITQYPHVTVISVKLVLTLCK